MHTHTLTETDLPTTTDRRGHVVELGSTVKSYDYPDMLDEDEESARLAEGDFVEGVVEGCVEFPDCLRYKIRVTRRLRRGRDVTAMSKEADGYVYPPLNGTPRTFGGECSGVVVVDSPKAATADEALERAYAALGVIAKDPHNREAVDPKALAQVERALAVIESYQGDLDAHLNTLHG